VTAVGSSPNPSVFAPSEAAVPPSVSAPGGPAPAPGAKGGASATGPSGVLARVRRWPSEFWEGVPRPTATVWTIIVAALVETGILSWIQWQNYLGFHSRQGDLGVFNQAFYTTVHGQGFFFYTVNSAFTPGGSLWAVHFSPTLVLLVPFYAIYASPLSLFVLKQAALCLAAVPLYGLARVYFRGNLVPVLFAAALLLSPLTMANDWNSFDPESLVPITTLTAIYFLAKGRFWPFLGAWFLALGTLESTPALLILFAIGGLLGVFLTPSFSQSPYWSARDLRRPLLIALVTAGVWLGAAYLVLLKLGRAGGFGTSYAIRYTILGATSFPSVPLRVLHHPGAAGAALQFDGSMKLLFVASLLLAAGGLCILAGLRYWLPLASYLFLALLSNSGALFSFGSQYPAIVSAFLFAGSVEAAALLFDLAGRRPLDHRTGELRARLTTQAASLRQAVAKARISPVDAARVSARLARFDTFSAANRWSRAEMELARAQRVYGSVTTAGGTAPARRKTSTTVGSAEVRQPSSRVSTLTTVLRVAVLLVVVISIVVATAYASPLQSRPPAGGVQFAFGLQGPTAADKTLDSVIGMIPAGASVLTTSHIFPEVSDRPNAYVVNNGTQLPTGLNLSDDLNYHANLSRFIVVDYAVDPTNAIFYLNDTNLSSFGLYAAKDGAYLLERGWTGAPAAWAPWTYTWDGGSLNPTLGVVSTNYAPPGGTSLYHPAGGAIGHAIWTGPKYSSMPPGVYAATYDLELQAPHAGSQLLLSIVEVNMNLTVTYPVNVSGYQYNQVNFHPGNASTETFVLNQSWVNTSAPSTQYTAETVTVDFVLAQPGYISFDAALESKTMSVYLSSVSVAQLSALK
jgi:uncharacterized membrane protein